MSSNFWPWKQSKRTWRQRQKYKIKETCATKKRPIQLGRCHSFSFLNDEPSCSLSSAGQEIPYILGRIKRIRVCCKSRKSGAWLQPKASEDPVSGLGIRIPKAGMVKIRHVNLQNRRSKNHRNYCVRISCSLFRKAESWNIRDGASVWCSGNRIGIPVTAAWENPWEDSRKIRVVQKSLGWISMSIFSSSLACSEEMK